VTDAEGRLLVFNLPGVESEVVVTKQEDTEGPINVERVVLVPLENWNPDFVQPTSVCVQAQASSQDRPPRCLLTTTRFPIPDTSVIAIPSQILTKQPARKLPTGIHNTQTPLIYVTRSPSLANPPLTLDPRYNPDHAESPGPVAAPDDYVFMVHYYQPDHPLLHLKVNISDLPADITTVPDFPVYEAVLPLPTCAAIQGCRSAVLRQKGDTQPGSFRITEKFDIHFTNEVDCQLVSALHETPPGA
jgi:laminin alpha 3/5